ncbi:MAG TPA: succinate dehydrogenase, cytochrome b556 subunit [Thermomicrobiales bacterium]|nr:succinate dehydrogenase, cytochrome b556 subunit [Thermomicrobiales bacterium]
MAYVSTEQGRAGLGPTASPGAERLMWYFLRVSGLALVFLAGGHIFITHYLNVPSDTTFDFVSKRWSNPLWRSFDTLLLLAALWHGLIGLRFSIKDFLRSPGARQIAMSLLWVFGAVFTVVGLITIVTFDEQMSRDNTGPLSGQMWIANTLGAFLVILAICTYVGVIALIVWVVNSLRSGIVPIYNGDVGQYAWVLHRATGIGILGFLLVHVIDIMLIGLGRDVYDHSVHFYGNWFIIPMEILLVGAVIYHTLNGLRIIAINFSSRGPSMEKKYFWWVLIGSVVLTLPSAIIILINEL